MGRYTVIVAQRADAMLVRHTRFLANVSIPAAKRLVAEFGQVVDSLEDNPFLFPPETDYEFPPGKFRKAPFGKRYKALFTVEGETVYLDAVLDCRQDNAKNLST